MESISYEDLKQFSHISGPKSLHFETMYVENSLRVKMEQETMTLSEGVYRFRI